MKSFVLNGKTYEHVDIDFDMICEFEENDISISNMRTRVMQFLRLYVTKCMGRYGKNARESDASREISAHLANGGTLEGLMQIYADATNGSSFFQAASKDEGQRSGEGETEAKAAL